MANPRVYNSPLRQEKSRETREAILTALLALMQAGGGPDDISMEAIAREAGVQRRTVFRHFAHKEELLMSFWAWLNQRIGASTEPETTQDVLDGPRKVFPLFDEHEAIIRAALHSRTGREMRLSTIPARRAGFSRALDPALRSLSSEKARTVEALAHLLYSASAWETLKDYGGLTGPQAGEIASWTLELVLSAIGASDPPADTQGNKR
ncbi:MULTISPECIES: TetR/AcrR family transcriptional regulator [unclassified Chelatococcus]|uniref:TetR/AcrR family transcriptional regulator n=1 Tax=unclassified Chelatococcus TaxID=2638111 RepID=UPI001BCE071D|nr:TetR/AcrR family transcriptional regulator [Chelatococcus sp.]MBS7700540.1 TetR/AcrR family transcriptional regulator [Chelatococcus sp. YT9]MBX3558655.1 TetR/AcrR family transcriptional regulator [Chelatococcus sp.]